MLSLVYLTAALVIDSPDNPLVKQVRALSMAKARRKSGLFAVEGVRAVEDGLRSGSIPATCLVNRELASRTARGRELLTQLRLLADAQMVQLAEVTERALMAAADTQQPQGIVAAFPMPVLTRAVERLTRPLILVCDEIRDPGNLGTILRSAEAAGVAIALLSKECVDPFNPKVVRAAAGAHFRLPLATGLSWDEVRSHLAESGVHDNRTFCAAGTPTALPYDAVDWSGASALVVSNEAHGRSAGADDLCRGGDTVAIPMLGGTESLNVAVAAAVILFEAARQRRAAAAAEPCGKAVRG